MKKNLKSAICIFLIAAFIVFCFSGCIVVSLSEPGGINARGNQETYEIKVGSFNAIRTEGSFDIHYYAAPSDTVTLLVQPNVREYIIIEVVNNELVIRTTRRISFGSGRTPVLTVSTPVLNRVSIQGAGDFTAHDKITADSLEFIITGAGNGKAELDVNRLSIEISGAGDLNLSGRANSANFAVSGAGDVKALELQTIDSTIRLSGAGDISISCSENLNINASGAGSIRYRGSPRINQNTSGPISIRQVN